MIYEYTETYIGVYDFGGRTLYADFHAKMTYRICVNNEILQIYRGICRIERLTLRRARLQFDTEIESLVGTRRASGLDLRRAGSTDVLTHRSTCSEAFPLRDLPLTAAAGRRKGATMPNRMRNHAICHFAHFC